MKSTPAHAAPAQAQVLTAHLERLRRRDLNALVTLHAVLRTRSVTGAARLLGLTQPAVSRTLERLRVELNDPLVLRQGNGIVPTNRAREIELALESLLDHAQFIYASASLQPSTERRNIHLAMNEHLQQLIVPPLLERTAEHAPGIRLFVRSILHSDMALLKDGHLDMILGMLPPNEHLRQQALLDQKLLCIAHRDLVQQLAREGPVTLATFSAHPQIDLQPAGMGQISAMLDGLCKGGKPHRNIACVVSSVEALMSTLEAGRYIGVVPELSYHPLSRHALDVVPLNFDLPMYRVSAWWHNVAHHDPALQWLRVQIQKSLRSLGNKRSP
jgi:DNA-binding transcriptional LysR family regulator